MGDCGADAVFLEQYRKNSKFPKLSDRVYYFKESKEGADVMTQSVEEYIKKRMLEQISEHDKETARFFYKNGASVELVKIPFRLFL